MRKPTGWILTALLAGTNAVHLLWTVWLTVEQVRTGWGYGTSMELAVLMPWLLIAAVVQYGVTNLFIWL